MEKYDAHVWNAPLEEGDKFLVKFIDAAAAASEKRAHTPAGADFIENASSQGIYPICHAADSELSSNVHADPKSRDCAFIASVNEIMAYGPHLSHSSIPPCYDG